MHWLHVGVTMELFLKCPVLTALFAQGEFLLSISFPVRLAVVFDGSVLDQG